MINIINKNFSSFKNKLLGAMFLLVAVFSLLTTYVWSSHTSMDAERSAIDSMAAMLKVSNSNFEIALKDIDQLVALIATNQRNVIQVMETGEYSSELEQFNDNKRIEEYIISLGSFKYYLGGIFVGGLNGRTYLNTASVSLDEVLGSPLYAPLLASDGKKVFIPPHPALWASKSTALQYKDQMISIARPIMSESKKLGFVIADIRCDLLKNLFDFNLENKGQIFIIDAANRNVIFSTEDPAKDKNNEYLLQNTKSFVSESGSFYTKINGENMLLVYKKSNYTDWISVGLVPKNKLMPRYEQTRRISIILSLLCICAALAIAFILSYLLTRDLLRLNIAMKQVDRSNLNISVDIQSRDEIGQLYFQFNSMLARIRELVQDVKNQEQKKRKAEIKALQAQINPHFLYNTLNTIKFLASLQKADNIKNVTESLSMLMHVNMDNRIFINLLEELHCIESYLNLQQYKYSDKFIFSLSMEDGLEKYQIPKLLLQPVVENALIHGIAPMKGQGVIQIKVYKETGFLKIRVQDNGVGMEEDQIEKLLDTAQPGASIGIPNVLSRIRMNFGESYGIAILSQKNTYTAVELTLPLITAEEVKNYA